MVLVEIYASCFLVYSKLFMQPNKEISGNRLQEVQQIIDMTK